MISTFLSILFMTMLLFLLQIKVVFYGVHVLLVNNLCYSPLITVVIKSRRKNWSRVLAKLGVTYKVPVGTDNMGDLAVSASKQIMQMENIEMA